MVTVFENLEFGQNFTNIPIFIKIYKNFNFSQNFRKTRLWSKITKASVLLKIIKKYRFL